MIRNERYGFVEVNNGIGKFAQPGLNQTAPVVQFGVIFAEFKGSVQVSDRSLKVIKFEACIPPARYGRGTVRRFSRAAP